MIASKVRDHNTGKPTARGRVGVGKLIGKGLIAQQTGYTNQMMSRYLNQERNLNTTSQRDGIDTAVRLWLETIRKNKSNVKKIPRWSTLDQPMIARQRVKLLLVISPPFC